MKLVELGNFTIMPLVMGFPYPFAWEKRKVKLRWLPGTECATVRRCLCSPGRAAAASAPSPRPSRPPRPVRFRLAPAVPLSPIPESSSEARRFGVNVAYRRADCSCFFWFPLRVGKYMICNANLVEMLPQFDCRGC